MTEYRSTPMTVYQLTLDVGEKTVTRWLFSYHVDDTGTLKGTDVRGNERVVGRAMPYSLAEREEIPLDVDYDEELAEAYAAAEEAYGEA